MLASGILGACVGYLLTLLVNFSVVPSALPFWIFLGAGVVILQGDAESPRPTHTPHHGRPLWLVAGLLAAALLSVVAIGLPGVADTRLHDSLSASAAGDRVRAARLAADARGLQPQQQLYAATAGNLAMTDASWIAAREAFMTAAGLGSFDPSVFRQLAIADDHLGLHAEAVAAAERSVELNRFDPRNLAVLQAVTSAPPG
jgi:hypothetical protein